MQGALIEPVSVVMPICNEALIVKEVVEEWHEAVFSRLPEGSELVFDDGDSRDGTLEILEELRGKHPYICILKSRRDGFAASARRLYQAARCRWIFFTDSDGQYVAEEFWKVAELAGKCDMVHGFKLNRQDPLYRRAASACFNSLSEWAFHTGFRDINSAFRLVSRSLVDSVLPQVHSMPTLLNAELLIRALSQGFRVKQVGVRHRPRRHGLSRGLPIATFARECLFAYRALGQLREELAQAKSSAGVLSSEAASPSGCER
jgi:glycosyltransferase involved in cell wall biosynthesis